MESTKKVVSIVTACAPGPNDDPDDSEGSYDYYEANSDYRRWTVNDGSLNRNGHDNPRVPDDRKNSHPHASKITKEAS